MNASWTEVVVAASVLGLGLVTQAIYFVRWCSRLEADVNRVHERSDKLFALVEAMQQDVHNIALAIAREQGRDEGRSEHEKD